MIASGFSVGVQEGMVRDRTAAGADYNPPQIVQVYGKDALTKLRDALTLALGKIPEGNHENESGED